MDGLYSQVQYDLGVDGKDPQFFAKASAVLMANAIEDCIGESAESFQSNFETVPNSSGNYFKRKTSTDVARCTAISSCNVEGSIRTTQEDCFWDELSGFCQICVKNNCRRVGFPSRCRILPDPSVDLSTLCKNYTATFRDAKCYLPSLTANSSTCLGPRPIEITTVGIDSVRSRAYCFDPLRTGEVGCTNYGGNWNSGISRCLYDLDFASCILKKFKFVPARIFTPGQLHSRSLCTSQTICPFNITRDLQDQTVCKAAYEKRIGTGYCDDFEYNNENDGLCTFMPVDSLFQCGGNFTQTGLCYTTKDKASCDQLTSRKWVAKATTRQECLAKGGYCEHADGKLSLLNSTSCTNCGATFRQRYMWIDAVNTYAMVPGEWKNITWASTNKMAKNLTVSRVRDLIETSASRYLARQSLNEFQYHLNMFITVFKAISCSCFEKQSNCFDETIKTEIEDCLVDPTKQSTCGGASFSPLNSKSNQTLMITVQEFSAANFLKKNETIVPVIGKRCNAPSDYEVVSGGGQIIGNGIMLQTTGDAFNSMELCLKVDKSIPKLLDKYPVYDIGYIFAGTIYSTFTQGVRFDGIQVCGLVYKIPDIIYIPVLHCDGQR